MMMTQVKQTFHVFFSLVFCSDSSGTVYQMNQKDSFIQKHHHQRWHSIWWSDSSETADQAQQLQESTRCNS
jgi:hypothetical protein